MAAMTDNHPETPAAFGGHVNGSPTPAQRTADGVTLIAELLPQLPQAVGMIVQQILQQTPVQTRQRLCAVCVATRKGWESAHERDLKAAIDAAAQAAGLEAGDPRIGQLDPAPFLPETLRPGAGSQGMPTLTAAITTVNGTEVCSAHVGGPSGGTQLLVASATFSPSAMLAGMG